LTSGNKGFFASAAYQFFSITRERGRGKMKKNSEKSFSYSFQFVLGYQKRDTRMKEAKTSKLSVRLKSHFLEEKHWTRSNYTFKTIAQQLNYVVDSSSNNSSSILDLFGHERKGERQGGTAVVERCAGCSVKGIDKWCWLYYYNVDGDFYA